MTTDRCGELLSSTVSKSHTRSVDYVYFSVISRKDRCAHRARLQTHARCKGSWCT